MHQMQIHRGQTSYHPNGLNNNQPATVQAEQGDMSIIKKRLMDIKLGAQ